MGGMSITAMGVRSLSDRIALKIKHVLLDKGMSGRDLARQLGVSQPWVGYRLSGKQEIGVNDLARIASVLEVPVTALLPEDAATVVQTGTGATAVYRGRAEKAKTPNRSPADNHPAGHPRGAGIRRPQLIGTLMERMIDRMTAPGLPAVA